MAGAVFFALRVVAPLMIAFVLLQRGLRRGTMSEDDYEERIAWLRFVALLFAVLFGLIGVVSLVAAITSRG